MTIMVTDCGTCGLPARCRYPGNDPENGPARPYCSEGHSTCYACGVWFPAVRRHGPIDDPEGYGPIPAFTTEADACDACERTLRGRQCGCGSDPTHYHGPDDIGGEWACCGGSMCCEAANE